MSTAISSARYTDLYDYCTTATQLNDDLAGQGGRLSSRLNHFEATCRESGFRTGGDNLGGALQSYSTWAMPIDQRVRKVGEDFQRADATHRSWWDTITQVRIDWKRLLGTLIVPGFAVLPLLPGAAKWVVDLVSKQVEIIKDITTWFSDQDFSDQVDIFKGIFTLVALGTLKVSKSDIPHRVGVSAPNLARFILRLPSKHLKLTTLTDKLKGRALGTGFIIAAGIKTIEQAKYDFETFKGDELKKWTAVVYDAALILTVTAGVALLTAGIVAILPVAGVAAGVATVGISLALGFGVDTYLLDPYLKGDWHKEHVDILTDNVREFKRDPLAFTKVFGGEIANRLGGNAEEFQRDPAAFTKVFGSEIFRVAKEGLTPVAAHVKDHASQLVDYILGKPEQPRASLAI